MNFKLYDTAFALLLGLTFLVPQTEKARGLPLSSLASEPSSLAIPIACKYGSGKCADVKPVHQAPSTEKHGPQDPTVDPDCGHYGNCRGGNPEGGSASLRKSGGGQPGNRATGNNGALTGNNIARSNTNGNALTKPAGLGPSSVRKAGGVQK